MVAAMLRRWPLIVATACLGMAGTVAATASIIDGPADMPTRSAVRADPPSPVIVVGDSAIAALRWVPGADNAVVGFEHTLDLESCRRLYVRSCRGREGRRPLTVYEALAEHGDKYDVLVVATGYNDSPESFDNSFRLIVNRARLLGYRQIVWFTLRSDVDYVSPDSLGNHQTFAQNNLALRRLIDSGHYFDVVLADWGGYTAEKPEWFVTDGVHYRAVGAWAVADYLTRKIAFLDGRACPFPSAPGVDVENPCPDPDATGPVVDIEGLYPVGQDGVLCYEVGTDHRVECRYDTHVIRLTRELAVGMTGSDVGALQVRLIRFGMLEIGADGVFGPATVDAVASFQTANDLNATGIADTATLELLGFDVSSIAVVGATTTVQP